MQKEDEGEVQGELSFADVSCDVPTRDERNMMEWVVGVLGDRAPEGVTSIRYSDSIETPLPVEGVGGEGKKRRIEREWIVRVKGENARLPTAFERDMLVALMALDPPVSGDHPSRDTVEFTIYEIAQIMRRQADGRFYERVEQALECLMSVEIEARSAFWNAKQKSYLTIKSHILQDIGIATGKAEVSGKSWVTWTRLWRASVEDRYFWVLNNQFYFSLKTATERRMFQLLNGRRFGNKTWKIGLDKWAYERIGLSRTMYPSQLKRELDKAHQTLKERRFLEDWAYEKTGSGWQVQYTFNDGVVRAKVDGTIDHPKPAAKALPSAKPRSRETKEEPKPEVTSADVAAATKEIMERLKKLPGDRTVDPGNPAVVGMVNDLAMEMARRRAGNNGADTT